MEITSGTPLADEVDVTKTQRDSDSDSSRAMIEQFFQREYCSLLRYAGYRIRRLQLTECNAEDLVQEAVLCVFKEHPDKIFSKQYLCRTMAYISYDWMVHRRRSSVLLQAYSTCAASPLEHVTPENALLENPDYDHLEQQLGKLWKSIAECLHDLAANATIRELLNPDTSTFFVNQKPAQLSLKLAKKPHTLSNYLLWIRKKLFPCVRQRFEQSATEVNS